jgi:hypothetical protein
LGNNIGVIYFGQQKFIEAKGILASTLRLMSRQDHPHTTTCKRNLAWTYAGLQDLDLSEKLGQGIQTSLRVGEGERDISTGALVLRRGNFDNGGLGIKDAPCNNV